MIIEHLGDGFDCMFEGDLWEVNHGFMGFVCTTKRRKLKNGDTGGTIVDINHNDLVNDYHKVKRDIYNNEKLYDDEIGELVNALDLFLSWAWKRIK